MVIAKQYVCSTMLEARKTSIREPIINFDNNISEKFYSSLSLATTTETAMASNHKEKWGSAIPSKGIYGKHRINMLVLY
jgi:hypothetical protein